MVVKFALLLSSKYCRTHHHDHLQQQQVVSRSAARGACCMWTSHVQGDIIFTAGEAASPKRTCACSGMAT
eukprot:1822896-Amphidinium_carterae.1